VEGIKIVMQVIVLMENEIPKNKTIEGGYQLDVHVGYLSCSSLKVRKQLKTTQ
jgi:hypothetical protein